MPAVVAESIQPIAIAWLKRFAADFDMTRMRCSCGKLHPATGKSIGIIGGGPGGLTAAYYLIQSGHAVTIYDAMPEAGRDAPLRDLNTACLKSSLMKKWD